MLRFAPVASAFAAFLLCACASLSDAGSKTASGEIDAPVAAGRARITVFAGYWYSDRVALRYPQSFVVSIDGIRVGQIEPDEAITVDVLPGRHVVARNLASLLDVQTASVSLDLGEVSVGERIYVAADRVAGGTEMPALASGAHADAALPFAPPHQEPGDYLDVRDDDPAMLAGKTFVAPDPSAAAELAGR